MPNLSNFQLPYDANENVYMRRPPDLHGIKVATVKMLSTKLVSLYL